MSANTAFLNLYKPGGGSSGLIVPDEVVDIDRINSNMDLIDSFASSWGLASRQTRDLTGPAASLASIVAAAGGARLNDTYQETDGNKIFWKYDGSNWVTNEGGLFLIRPTAVTGTGVTIGPDGAVVFTAVNPGAVQVQGIFSSRYRNYRLYSEWTSKPSAASNIQGIVGSTVVSSASHDRAQSGYLNGARGDQQSTNGTNYGETLVPNVGASGSGIADFFSPNTASATQVHACVAYFNGYLGVSNSIVWSNASDQLTGLQFNLGGASPWTGRVRAYGLA